MRGRGFNAELPPVDYWLRNGPWVEKNIVRPSCSLWSPQLKCIAVKGKDRCAEDEEDEGLK